MSIEIKPIGEVNHFALAFNMMIHIKLLELAKTNKTKENKESHCRHLMPRPFSTKLLKLSAKKLKRKFISYMRSSSKENVRYLYMEGHLSSCNCLANTNPRPKIGWQYKKDQNTSPKKARVQKSCNKAHKQKESFKRNKPTAEPHKNIFCPIPSHKPQSPPTTRPQKPAVAGAPPAVAGRPLPHPKLLAAGGKCLNIFAKRFHSSS